MIEMAKTCDPPESVESGQITGGFGHSQVLALADKVIEAVKSGAIKRFVVMAGCDGRHKTRDYYTQVAKALPEDAVILTAGCAKYKYNKLDLGGSQEKKQHTWMPGQPTTSHQTKHRIRIRDH